MSGGRGRAHATATRFSVRRPEVIYAAANRVGGRAAREHIIFKQTPYAL